MSASNMVFSKLEKFTGNGTVSLNQWLKNFERCCVIAGWCNLHNAGCIIQVAGHVLWPRAAWRYQEAVTNKKANISVSGGLQIVGM